MPFDSGASWGNYILVHLSTRFIPYSLRLYRFLGLYFTLWLRLQTASQVYSPQFIHIIHNGSDMVGSRNNFALNTLFPYFTVRDPSWTPLFQLPPPMSACKPRGRRCELTATPNSLLIFVSSCPLGLYLSALRFSPLNILSALRSTYIPCRWKQNISGRAPIGFFVLIFLSIYRLYIDGW